MPFREPLAARSMGTPTQHYWRDSALPFIELRSTYHSLQSYKPHFHPQLSFGAVTAGQARASWGGREVVLGRGDLVLIAPHVVHSCNPVARQPRSYHMLYLDEAWCLDTVRALKNRSLADACGAGFVIRDGGLLARYLDFVADLARMPASTAAARLQRLLTDAMSRNSVVAPSSQPQLLGEQIKRMLLDRIDSPPTLDELASIFGCRKETLIRAFRRAHHTTPRAFVNNARIELVKQRLKQGAQIAYVAADLGFSDQAQLHRTFVSYTASTPGQYRRTRPAINFRQ